MKSSLDPRPRSAVTALAAGTALTVLAALTAAPASAAPATTLATSPTTSAVPALHNAGFESGLDGWTVTGTTSAARTEADGRTGQRLTHWAGSPYGVSTSQTLTGLDDGWLTVSVWVKSGGALDASTLALTGCGVDDGTTTPLTEQDDAWVRVAVSAYVTTGQCTVELATSGPAGAWASFDEVEISPGQVTRSVRGGDLSGVAKNEAFGATYATADGTPGDPVELLAEAGMNLGRLKVWVDPADGWNDTDDVVATARRIKAAGLQLLVDFHYSDRWTDPGAQGVPAAWADLSPADMAQAVHDHTREVLDALAAEGITADYVQVGNEINPGMLWPWGQTWDVDPDDGVAEPQWDNLAMFLTAGATAVREVSTDTRVILHLTNINNGIGGLTWWFDEITARDVPFDVIGLSYYGYWHGSLADLQEAVTVLSERYDRDVLNVETAYPFTLADDAPTWENVIDLESELVPGYPATPAGQAAALRAVQDVVASAPGGRGIGTVYWEPAWTAVEGAGWDPADPTSGNAWENQALFDFDGRLLPAAAELAPDAVAPQTPARAETTTSLRVNPTRLRTTSRPMVTIEVATGPGTGDASDERHARSGRDRAPGPVGEVQVLVDGEVVAGEVLDGRDRGRVRMRVPQLAAGRHTVTAVYMGSSAAAPSTAEVTVDVRR